MGGGQVDIVIPWVDGNDPAWRAERDRFWNDGCKATLTDAGDARYRDVGTLKYVLRGIDRFMPWAGTVHFVTWGHLPEWLDPDAPGLHVVNHRDYIPGKYLPTFSSHTIELNFHRIPGLAERFVYFNDDMLVLRDTVEDDFFRNGLPRDYAVETALSGSHYRSIAGVVLCNMEILNEHFSKKDVFRRNFFKWFNLRYGTDVLKTVVHLPWPRFSDFTNYHTPFAYLKSTFEEAWKTVPAELDETCSHRFRQLNDVNQWFMRGWQLLSGTFVPKSPRDGMNFNMCSKLPQIAEALTRRKYRLICINDDRNEEPGDYDALARTIREMLEKFLPDRSRFEK